MTLKGFPERLNRAISKTNLSVYDIVSRAEISKTTLYYWLDGVSCPNAVYLARICKVLNVSADYLLFGKEKQYVRQRKIRRRNCHFGSGKDKC